MGLPFGASKMRWGDRPMKVFPFLFSSASERIEWRSLLSFPSFISWYRRRASFPFLSPHGGKDGAPFLFFPLSWPSPDLPLREARHQELFFSLVALEEIEPIPSSPFSFWACRSFFRPGPQHDDGSFFFSFPLPPPILWQEPPFFSLQSARSTCCVTSYLMRAFPLIGK